MEAADGARIARLAREAVQGYSRPAGKAPACREEEEDDIFRDFLSSMLEINRQIGRQKDQVDSEALATLYTAKSFATPEAMGRATRAVRELLQTNRRVAGQMERALGHAKSRVESSKWTSLEKALFWREFAEGFATKFQLRSELLEVQRVWTEATSEAYEFALCHSQQLHFEGKTVRASNREVGRGFIEKLKRARVSREDFRRAAAEIQEERAAVLAKWDIAEPSTP
jgi:hypothetical protein